MILLNYGFMANRKPNLFKFNLFSYYVFIIVCLLLIVNTFYKVFPYLLKKERLSTLYFIGVGSFVINLDHPLENLIKLREE